MKESSQPAASVVWSGMSFAQLDTLDHLLDLMEPGPEPRLEADPAPPLRRPETTLRDLGPVQLIGMRGGMCEPPVMSLNVRDGDDQASALLTEAQALQLAREICQMVGGWRS